MHFSFIGKAQLGELHCSSIALINDIQAIRTERNEFFPKVNTFIVPFESYTSQEQFLILMCKNDTEVLTL